MGNRMRMLVAGSVVAAQICKFFILSFFFSLLFFGNNFLLSSSRERKRGLPNKRKKNNRAAHTHHMPMRLEREGWASKHAAQLASRRKEIKIWNNSSIHVLFFFISFLLSYPSVAMVKPTGENMAAGWIEWLCHLDIGRFLSRRQINREILKVFKLSRDFDIRYQALTGQDYVGQPWTSKCHSLILIAKNDKITCF